MNILKALALATVPAVGAFLCVLILNVNAGVERFNSDEATIAHGVATSIDKVNQPCRGSGLDKADNCGTLALAGQVMVNAGHLIERSDTVEKKETLVLDQQLPQLFDKANLGLDRMNDAAGQLKPLLVETTRRTAALQPIEANAATLLADMDLQSKPLFTKASTGLDRFNQTLFDVDAVVSNKDIPLTFANARKMTDSGAGILQDGKDEADKLVHPPKKKLGFWAATEAGGDYARHFMPPLF